MTGFGQELHWGVCYLQGYFVLFLMNLKDNSSSNINFLISYPMHPQSSEEGPVPRQPQVRAAGCPGNPDTQPIYIPNGEILI